jgi:hypothetical protein
MKWNGNSYTGENGDWDWADYYYKVFKDPKYTSDICVKFWNNDEMNEYVKLRPTRSLMSWETDLIQLGEWREVRYIEAWKNERYRTNYYLEYETPYLILSQNEMKQKNDDDKLKVHNDMMIFIERFKRHKIKLNTDKYTELKVKINKQINKNNKNRSWSKCIEVYDFKKPEQKPEQTFLFGERFANFIWVKTTLDEWKIYRIYERWVEYKTRNRDWKRDPIDNDYIRLKKIEEYIIPIRDINTHYKTTEFIRNKTLKNSILNVKQTPY